MIQSENGGNRNGGMPVHLEMSWTTMGCWGCPKQPPQSRSRSSITSLLGSCIQTSTLTTPLLRTGFRSLARRTRQVITTTAATTSWRVRVKGAVTCSPVLGALFHADKGCQSDILAKQIHPDKNLDELLAKERFQKLDEAYQASHADSRGSNCDNHSLRIHSRDSCRASNI